MAIETYATGRPTNNNLTTYSFLFDFSDKNVNFTDGTYNTQCVLKNNTVCFSAGLKYYQSLALYPAMTITIFNSAASWNIDVLPIANTPNKWAYCNQGIFPPTILNPNGEPFQVSVAGITGSGIPALSFEFFALCNEFEV